MPDHLIVIRSPATDYERQGRIRGSLDLPPCPEGLAGIRTVAAALAESPPDAIYTAPSSCATEAGRIIGSRCQVTPKPLDLLANLDLGLWQGKLVSELRRQHPRTFRQWQEDPWSVIPPKGELLDEARGRVELALERIFKRHRTGRVAVVVPTPLDAVVRWLVAGEPLGDLWQRDPGSDPVAVLPVAAQWQAGAAASPPPPLSVAVPAPRPDATVR